MTHGDELSKTIKIENNGTLDFNYQIKLLKTDDGTETDEHLSQAIRITCGDTNMSLANALGNGAPLVEVDSIGADPDEHTITLTLDESKTNADLYSGKSIGTFEIQVIANENVKK